MTIAEMHIAVKLGLDKSSALELPSFEPEEIDFWLNKAILQFVDSRYSGYNNKKESVESNQRVTDDLVSLIKEVPAQILSQGSVLYDKPNSYVTLFQTWWPDYYKRLSEEVMISYTNSITNTIVSKRQGITECTSDSYRAFIDNPYSEHRLYLGEAKPLRLFKGEQSNMVLELITDGNYSITMYFLKYLKIPSVVSITTPTNCDLPLHTHHRIVDLTVSMLLENIESNRYQGFKSESSTSE
jgi:hypothetical protein